jgi:hypothetical protein
MVISKEQNDDKNLLKNVNTSDKTWVYAYDVEPKRSPHWKSPTSPQPKKAQQVRS